MERKDFSLSELLHTEARSVPSHEHSLAYFALLLRGGYEEEGRKGFDSFTPFSAMFHPCGTRHTGKIMRGGAEFFTVEVGANWFLPFHKLAHEAHLREVHGGRMIWLLTRLHRCYRDSMHSSVRDLPDDDALTIESLIGELLEEASSVQRRNENLYPAWLNRAVEILEDAGDQPVEIGALAESSGLHPVYFARAFRLRAGCTAGEYLQRVRVRRACLSLANADIPLSRIAADCGFADQSHMTRVFQKIAGTTPAKFRSQLCPRK